MKLLLLYLLFPLHNHRETLLNNEICLNLRMKMVKKIKIGENPQLKQVLQPWGTRGAYAFPNNHCSLVHYSKQLSINTKEIRVKPFPEFAPAGRHSDK